MVEDQIEERRKPNPQPRGVGSVHVFPTVFFREGQEVNRLDSEYIYPNIKSK